MDGYKVNEVIPTGWWCLYYSGRYRYQVGRLNKRERGKKKEGGGEGGGNELELRHGWLESKHIW